MIVLFLIVYAFVLFCFAFCHCYLGNKLDEKEKFIKLLKDEIKELLQPEDFSCIKVDHSLAIIKLNQDILDLEINNNELKQQLDGLQNQYKDLSLKVIKCSIFLIFLLSCMIIKLVCNT